VQYSDTLMRRRGLRNFYYLFAVAAEGFALSSCCTRDVSGSVDDDPAELRGSTRTNRHRINERMNKCNHTGLR
jgi:hypothetical protein